MLVNATFTTNTSSMAMNAAEHRIQTMAVE